LDRKKVQSLRDVTAEYQNVHIYDGDCNEILTKVVLPQAKYEKYRRALCLLDPYGLHLDWQVIKMAGEMKTVEIFINFPVSDMNRNVLWKNPERVDPQQAARLTTFWGDESWREIAYDTSGSLFGWEEKTDNETIAAAFKRRLKKAAGFLHVPDPIPMRNKKEATLYYFFFAAQKPVAKDIVEDIFNKYRYRGGR